MATMDSEQDSQHLSTSDCHSSEHNSVLLALETFLKEYRRCGKIHWAILSWFQPHWSFCGNTFALPWLKVLIS